MTKLHKTVREPFTYPIYRLSAVWDQDGYPNNSSSSDVIFREELLPGQLITQARKFWTSCMNHKQLRELHPILKSLEMKFLGYDSWALLWFSHVTFVDGRTDEELLQSFREFVHEKLPFQRNSDLDAETRRLHGLETYCLMGADDEWRWKGPCHCEHCVKLGRTIITH